jgi:predicted AAA+ superfamily ATPase
MVSTSDSRRRLLGLPGSSFFLLGVRGVGKSTWARAMLADGYRIDLLDERRYQDLLANPALLAAELRALPARSWVIVDEIQRVPALLNEVHRLIEERRLRFALLGSSARKLKSTGTNLLAGRALQLTLFPFVPAELGGDFHLTTALTYGTIPLVWNAQDRRATLDSYVQLYLREEIRGEALVRNLPGFARFLPIAALFHGQTINVTGLAHDAGVARTTVQGYLDILEDTLLTVRLPGYEAKLRVRERKLPKLYWIDAGLVRAVKRQLGSLAAEERGALLEGWILHLLRAHGSVSELYDEIYYWSPTQATKTEVDFLLRRAREFVAIEVKAAERFSERLVDGLRAIADLRGVARRILVYAGSQALILGDGIEVWPHARFAEALETRHLWP